MKVRSVLQGPGFSYQQKEEENSETRPAVPASAFLESKALFLLVISFLKGAWLGLSLSKNHGSLSRVPASCLSAQTMATVLSMKKVLPRSWPFLQRS